MTSHLWQRSCRELPSRLQKEKKITHYSLFCIDSVDSTERLNNLASQTIVCFVEKKKTKSESPLKYCLHFLTYESLDHERGLRKACGIKNDHHPLWNSMHDAKSVVLSTHKKWERSVDDGLHFPIQDSEKRKEKKRREVLNSVCRNISTRKSLQDIAKGSSII